MKRLFLFLVLLPVLLASPALAVAPSTMSYQGVLMDDAGVIVPDGVYLITFRLYTVPSGGSAIWSESHNPVPVARGGFSVVLGSVVSLEGIAFDVPYWLGITVGAGTEMTPRVQLASSPYGLSLRLPFAGGVSSAGPVFAIGNPGGGPAITADPLLTVGTASSNGTARLFENGVVGAEIGDWNGSGGSLHLYGPTGSWTYRVEPDIDGSDAGWFYVGAAGGGLTMDGNNGAGGATLSLSGPGGATYFNTQASGNDAVMLPPNSIAASEILDEPGVAQGHALYSVSVPSGNTMGDIVTTTLTTPADGYIVVEADGQHAFGGSASATYNYAELQIDETVGGGIDFSHDFISGYYGTTAGSVTGYSYHPVSIRRTYYKSTGTYTFRLEALGQQSEVLANYIYNPTITATFYPVSYGTVTTAVAPEEAIQFTDVQRAVSSGQLPQGGSVEGALVDLRELELKVARQKAELEASQRQLIEARRAQQDARPATSKQP